VVEEGEVVLVACAERRRGGRKDGAAVMGSTLFKPMH
jgi:hypothetical protein